MKQGELVYTGKAKSLYRTDTPGHLYVRFRDDITAFDGGKKDVLASKGSLNAMVSAKIFSLLEDNGIPTHFVRREGDCGMIVRDLRMIPLEVIVRNIAAGSLSRNYPVPEGMHLDPPIIVIDYKDDLLRDPMLNDDIIVTALRLVSREELAEIKALALRVNAVLRRFFAEIGITLVDFKLEFGRDADRIVVGDEISMDSMRLWDTATGVSLDKDVYRFGKGDVLAVYREVAARALSGDEQK
ncbi:MAG TPA: phosphoribosylaminoimidazolesuccinocarboxamide synthase [Methanoregulaceae archaeon]|nr:MAG: phosphoribosylaminoimidazolesuccinocarboxamide synthase [Methanolinea sp.]HON81195.1 phosphoribosylaminoimidazolesuccinocarboxamide synthase [Methanoregulaceae archaeon]HPD09861.1 phosphoribosylaminoimidazolesuccinocarboxamide synthase [Methanoregulaceae archaeon]HRT14948.1 phosphoribosylaminoimidazolesuccinocarboxamide synthase [Methanoregulaceae archaeon]HRU30437.1 phosphoribosylaminoimidazolesuccinocarboxamide synthase [Methanoregulaceae archaeon]